MNLTFCINLAVSILTLSSLAHAESDCSCTELPAGEEMSDLVEFAKDLNDHFGSLDGNSFKRSVGQIESYKLVNDHAELQKRVCPKNSRKKNKTLSVVVRAVPSTFQAAASAQEAIKPPNLLWNSLMMMYHKQHQAEAKNCANELSGDACYSANLNKVRSAIESKISTSTVDNAYLLVPDSAEIDGSKRLPTGVLMKAVYAESFQDYLKILKENERRLSHEQKLMILADLYQSNRSIYDLGRKNQSIFGNNKDSIDGDQLLFAIKEYYVVKKKSEFGALDSPSGVCRDHASLIALSAEALGFKLNYVLTHTTSTPHSTVVFQDPKVKSRYYKFDYLSNVQVDQKEGPELLSQIYSKGGDPSATLNYRLHKPYGETVAIMPSEMDKILSEAVQIDSRKKEPLTQTRSSLTGSRIDLSDTSSVQLFYGNDQSNTQYAGAAYSKSYRKGTRTPGHMGAGLAFSKTNDALTHAFVAFEQEAKTKDFSLVTEQIKARVDATFLASFMLTENISNFKSENLFKGFGDYEALNLGVQAAYKNKGETVLARLRAEAQFALGTRNVSQVGGAAGAWDSLTVFLNHHLYTAEGRAKLAETPLGRLYLFSAASVVFDHFGPRGTVKVGAETDRLAARFELVGRLNDETPTFKEGSLRKAKISLSYPMFKNFQLYMTGSKSLEAAVAESRDSTESADLEASGGIRGEW